MAPIHRNRSPSLYAATMRADYNAHSNLQRASVDASTPYIDEGVNAYRGLVSATSSLTIADFGSSVGANSSRAISILIKTLHAKFANFSSIIVIHNDLPRNSWTTLFDFIYNDAESYVNIYDNVFSVASGQSFYRQIVPSNSLNFGYSNMALQWLSEMPVKLKNHCFPMFASTQEEFDSFKQIADRDWRAFLTARSVELVQGGVLVIYCPAKKDGLPPEELWQKGRLAADALYRAAKRLFDDHCLITEDELLNFNVPVHIRDYSDVVNLSLFDELGYEVICADLKETPESPFYKAFQVHKDVAQFADETCFAMATALEPTFMQAFASTRSKEEKKAICRALWQEYRHLITLYPDEFNISGSGVYLVLRKK